MTTTPAHTSRTYAYIKPKSAWVRDADTSRQRTAIKAISGLLGLSVGSGDELQEVNSLYDTNLQLLLKRLQFGDTLIVSEPSVLSNRPVAILELVSSLMGRGIRLVVASLSGGRFDIDLFRSILEPMVALESELDALKAEMAQMEKDHEREFAEFTAKYDNQVMASLQRRGLKLSSLLRPEGTDDVQIERPDQGRDLKELRERLSLSQEQAGKLLTPAADKSAISRIENSGSAAPRYQDYSVALNSHAVIEAASEHKRLKEVIAAPNRPAQAAATLKAAQAREIATANIAS